MPQHVAILSEEAIRQLAEDHRRLAAEVRNLQWRLRAYMQQSGDEPKATLKEWGRATFDSAFTSSDSSVEGTLTDQWGYGTEHDEDETITLLNLETGTDGEYVYWGNSGGACWCRYTGVGHEWILVIPQCP